MKQSQENGQKPHSGPNLDHFWPSSGQDIYFSKIGLHHIKSFIEGLQNSEKSELWEIPKVNSLHWLPKID